jgi:hypothetical protein
VVLKFEVTPRSNLAIHAEALRTRGTWFPVMIDMEGRRRGKEDGIKTVDRLADFGVDLYALTTDAEAGAEEIANRIATGRLKVMSPLIDWIAEYRNLRRDQKARLPRRTITCSRARCWHCRASTPRSPRTGACRKPRSSTSTPMSGIRSRVIEKHLASLACRDTTRPAQWTSVFVIQDAVGASVATI